MAKKEKEEERIERILRSLLKLPENRRCINCNSLGPQYVCTTFLTFVCTNCSGVHREFTHRVKSVSMAKFSAEEVTALQAAGNERARQIYFKEWDPQRNSYPDGSNLHRLRDFIKHVYVDRKYAGERNDEKLQRLRLSNKDDFYESRKVGTYCGGSRSPNYEDRHEQSERYRISSRSDDRSFKYYYDERRSPRYALENSRYGGFKRSPARFEVVDDRIRDDRVQSGRQSGSHRFSLRESRFASMSPDHQKNMNQSSFPVLRPVKDIVGESVLPLQVGECSKANDRKDADGCAHNQMVASSGSTVPNDGNPVEQKCQNSENLIDLNNDSQPSNSVAVPQMQENHPSNDGSNCLKESATPAPKPNTLEFLLSELSVPSVVPASNLSKGPSNDDPPSLASVGNIVMSDGVSVDVPQGQTLTLHSNAAGSTTLSGGNLPAGSVLSAASRGGQASILPNSASASNTASGCNMLDGVLWTAPVGQMSASTNIVGELTTGDPGNLPVDGTSPMGQTLMVLDPFDASTTPTTNLPAQNSNKGPPQAAPDFSGDSTFKVLNGQQVSTMQQHQPTVFLAADDSSTGQQTTSTPVRVINDQPTSLSVPNAQVPSSTSAEHPSQDVSKPDEDFSSGVKSQSLSVETKSSGRKELPEDLFTATYSLIPGATPGWRTGPHYSMGCNMQHYPNTMPVVAYPNTANSSNPFDLNSETNPAQVQSVCTAFKFPSMGNFRGALPDVSASGLSSHASSMVCNTSGMMATRSPSFASTMPPPSPSYASAMSSGAYSGQQVHMNMPSSRPQVAGGIDRDGLLFGSLNMTQQSFSECPLPTTPSSLPSKGGNPFG